MIAIEKIQVGDTLVWIDKCGEVFGKVKRIANGMLAVFTDNVHCFPIDLLCGCHGTRLIEGEGERMHATAEHDTENEVPVLF